MLVEAYNLYILGGFIMDTAYVQLCAEMAYNEVIMESYFNEADEGNDNSKEIVSIKERFIKFIEIAKKFILKIYNRIKDFILEKIKDIKEKINKEKERKQDEDDEFIDDDFEESDFEESFIEPIGDIVINEGYNYDDALRLIHKDVISKVIDAQHSVINLKQNYSSKLLDCLPIKDNESSDIKIKQMYRYVDNFKDDVSLLAMSKIPDDIDKAIKDIIEKSTLNNKSDIKPSNGFIKLCEDILKEEKKNTDNLIDFLDIDLKGFESNYRSISNDKDLEKETKDRFIAYNRSNIQISNKTIECFNKISGTYTKILSIILKNFAF